MSLDPLEGALSPGALVRDPGVIAGYAEDWSRYPPTGSASALVRATTEADVRATLSFANEARIPVVPRGAGSGLSGGATAVEGAIILSLERMAAIRVDQTMRVAVAQAGALNVAVKKAAAAAGLWYPPDPSSFEICSIGGNAATNAGGMCCVKYGVTSDYVLGMRVALADGTLLDLGGPRLKDSAGLSLTKLFVGSEGTLGVITELTLRLLPMPCPSSTLVAFFREMKGAVAAVTEAVAVTRPSTLELMDDVSLNAVEDMLSMGLDRSAGALLICCSDAPEETARAELSHVEAVCARHGAAEVYVTTDPAESEAFLAARRAALPALERKGNLLIEDIGVPIPCLDRLVERVREIATTTGVEIAVIAHAGDGNTHPTIVYDASDEKEACRARSAFDAVMALALELGGTITGEHGVGRFKQPWLEGYLGEEVAQVSRRIKAALDPAGILNPGAMF